VVTGHAFLSYVHEDAEAADRLQQALEAAGVRVWRDVADLWPGMDWRAEIRRAITDRALAFIACFSSNSVGRRKSYQNEELTLAVEQLRQRQPDDVWLIPVRFDECTIPDRALGAGRTLKSLQRVDLFGDREPANTARLITSVLRLLGQEPEAAGDGPATTPAITDRWKLTNSLTDAPAMSQLGHQVFDHPAYIRFLEQAPPSVRVRAVVGCSSLGETPGWKELRGLFLGLLTREPVSELIGALTDVQTGAVWRPRGTPRRSWLEADLGTGDESAVPAASANLFLPEQDAPIWASAGCAQFTLRVDLAAGTPTAASGPWQAHRLPYWRALFERSLVLPGDLSSWLESQLGLLTSREPAPQFGILLQARQSIAELVDATGIPALSAHYVANQFTGWAVADAVGKDPGELASQLTLDLSERILHLDGTLEQMSGMK